MEAIWSDTIEDDAANAPTPRPATLFFAPTANLVQSFVAQALLARTLQERGHRVLLPRCSGLFPRCTVFDSYRVEIPEPEERRARICRRCVERFDEMTATYGLETVDLDTLLTEAMREMARKAVDEAPEDLSRFSFQGLRFGLTSAQMVSLVLKPLDPFRMDEAGRSYLLRLIETSILTHLLVSKLIEQENVRQLVFYSEYPMNVAAALAARRHAVPIINMTHCSLLGVDARFIMVGRQIQVTRGYLDTLDQWEQWKHRPLSPEIIRGLMSDSLFRMTASSGMVYSAARTSNTDAVWEQLRLEDGRRTIVAYTSSVDEISADRHLADGLGTSIFDDPQPFEDQIDWLSTMIDHVEASSDLQLVVRVHPREGANLREQVEAEHLSRMRRRFACAYRHVRFVWPADTVSSYDLMELADAGVTSWSTLAVDLARMGVPSLAAWYRVTAFPVGGAIRWRGSRDGFVQELVEIAERTPGIEDILEAFRWRYAVQRSSSIDMSDVVTGPECNALPEYRTPAAATLIEQVFMEGGDARAANYDAMQERQGAAAYEREREALLEEMRRAVFVLGTGKEPSDGLRLFHTEAETFEGRRIIADLRPPSGFTVAVVKDGRHALFVSADHVRRWRSPLVLRLAQLSWNCCPG
ncbi:hypothetical protein [Azospirillum sp. Marseille-Q6669]